MHLLHDPAAPPMPQIGFDQFLAVDIRIGTVIAAEPFPQARKPALQLTVDFGAGLGTRKSSAQITQNYHAAALIGRQVAAVVNFASRPTTACRMARGCSDATSALNPRCSEALEPRRGASARRPMAPEQLRNKPK